MVTAAARAKYPKPICYSPLLKYVFIHIPKCAGSSIHRALGVLHAQRSWPVGKPKYHKHAKATKVREVLGRSEEHTSELQSHSDLVCRLLLEKKKDSTATAVQERR